MLSSVLFLVAPLALSSAASALPKNVNLGPGENAQIKCQGEAVAKAFGLSTASNVPSFQGGERPVAVVAASESLSSSSASSSVSAIPLPSTSQTTTSPVNVTAPFSNSTVKNTPSGYRNALYFTNWGIYGANYQPEQLPGDKVTHVLYAFADIGPDGEVHSSDSYSDLEKHYPTDSWNDQGQNAYGCVKQLYMLKKKHRHMKTLLSIGGWTYSPKFAPVAATEAGRQKFCNSSVTLMKDWGFDGLDIDWEYPTSPSQAQDYVSLLATCRAALDTYAATHAPGYHFQLTIAAPAGPQNYNTLDLPAMDRYLDAWHIMAYDYAGSWDATTGHQANLYPNPSNPQATKFSTDRAVADYLARGIPPRKLVLGMPLYGRAFEATTGLGRPYAGVGQGSTQPGIWLLRDLPRPGAVEMWDGGAGASYSFDEGKGELVSYDTVGSGKRKAGYLVGKGLGGAVFWEASGDGVGEGSLVGAVAGEMGRLEGGENWLSYPVSRYDNIRMGVPGG
ncbi:glycoside hydrolase family 18 protein [Chaetomium tenue]|uniref:Glycoside hydrolase family 18 protein n=1 Tax=Chaetomium tenue TaxID=1854479 RepID=A0ACB7PPC1_9PEZI|nr:glycoside hydrolase family 18 protein [Chaetomium globosum]